MILFIMSFNLKNQLQLFRLIDNHSEIAQTNPKRSVIQALCAYLEQEKELRISVIQLKQTVLS